MARVLVVCEYPTLSGGERSLLALVPKVQQTGIELLAACPAEGPLAEAFSACGVEVVPFSVREGDSRRPLNRLRQALAELIGRVRPHLVHANSLSMSRLAGPVVAHLQLPGLGHLRDIIRLGAQAVADLNMQSRLLAVSHATREYHLKQGVAGEKIHVLYNGVDLSLFRPRAPSGWLHRKLQLPENARLVGTIGQICLRKGQDVLLAAAKSVAEPHPEAHFLIVGRRWSKKEESRRFEAQLQHAARGALAGRVHLLGWQRDVAKILDELTLLVHPARQEPLGRVLLEAAASGVPVVATEVGGTPEIFPPGSSSAVLVPPDDPRRLAEAICELLADEPRRERLARAARKQAESRFDHQQAAAGLVGHYAELARTP